MAEFYKSEIRKYLLGLVLVVISGGVLLCGCCLCNKLGIQMCIEVKNCSFYILALVAAFVCAALVSRN
jgi:hypothetical protein